MAIARRLLRLTAFAAAAVGAASAVAAGCSSDVEDPSLAPTASSSSASGVGGGDGGDAGGLTISVGAGGGTSVPCANVTCEVGEICTHDVCVPEQSCSSDDDCQYDTYCDPQTGCLPWDQADPPHDAACAQVTAAGILQPTIQCEFATPPQGDPFMNHVDVQGTPMVVHLVPDPGNLDDPGPGPSSIVAAFTATVVNNYTEDLGILRVINGEDCSLQANLGGVDLDNDMVVDWVVSSATVAAADLDGDGVPEVVAYGADGSTLAFTYKAGVWSLLWKAPLPGGAPWSACAAARCPLGWAGPSIHDLDDDGVPEVIREGVVFSASGAVLSTGPAGYASYGSGLFPVLANLDADANIELTNGQLIWEWVAGAWVQEAGFPGVSASAPGLTAVADFGDYGSLGATMPEIAVVRGGSVMVYAGDGTLAHGPIAIPGGGSGGPPTISDFDGDGLPELGVAGIGAYTVYDIDCGAAPRPGGVCPAGSCDFAGGACPSDIAWSRNSQDISSSVTGSSVFDFEADGSAEVIYGDECFTRVYDGGSGEVLFSQFRSSCTWHENPIIADVDGDFRAELITPSNKACSLTGTGKACTQLNVDGVDPLFNGLRCEDASDCVSGVCDYGLCRCNAHGQCCPSLSDTGCQAEGWKCVPPEAGTPGNGNTCRAAHPAGVSGIRVYSDSNDQWVSSRRIWNQHAYAVTHVNESGTIPQTSMWADNWLDPQLNNFRQNVPGIANGQAIPDATAGASKGYVCETTAVTLLVDVCNRGALGIGAKMPVGFYVAGNLVCSAETTQALLPDQCEQVACSWPSPPTDISMAVDVEVVADDGSTVTECKEGNNTGGIFDVFCKPAG